MALLYWNVLDAMQNVMSYFIRVRVVFGSSNAIKIYLTNTFQPTHICFRKIYFLYSCNPAFVVLMQLVFHMNMCMNSSRGEAGHGRSVMRSVTQADMLHKLKPVNLLSIWALRKSWLNQYAFLSYSKELIYE